MTVLSSLVDALADGSVRVVDLTQPLSDKTPLLQLPEPFVNTPGWKLRELSRYDERGPAWCWNSFEGGEHVSTHFDAPIHWATGKDKDDVSQVPPGRLVGPAVVIDKSAEAAADADFLLEVDHVRAFEADHGPLPRGGWLLYRTGWDARAHDQAAFLNANETGPHAPGFSPECARWLAEESPLVGVGVETVGTDAGAAHSFDPPFPCHSFMLGAGKCGRPGGRLRRRHAVRGRRTTRSPSRPPSPAPPAADPTVGSLSRVNAIVLAQKAVTSTHVALYRLTNGLVGHRIGLTEAVLLTTTGRKSGAARTTPLTATPDGDRLVLVASNGGARRHPDWYLNLVAHPEVEVQRGSKRRRVRARTADAEERARLWPKVVATYRGYEDYQRRAAREIPLVVLDPA